MNEEIDYITNEGKTTKNEWENDDFDFLLVFYSVYKTFFPHNFLTSLFKQRYISSIASYKYLDKLISEK